MCVAYSHCLNTNGSYLCNCNSGFSGDGFVDCYSKDIMQLLCVYLLVDVFLCCCLFVFSSHRCE